MGNLNKKISNPNIALFTIFMIFVIFFTTSDLVANFSQEPIWASLFSIISGFFVFLGTSLKKKKNIEKGINAQIDYINNNFSKSAVILSILDIICSLIAVFTTIFAIGIIFRSIFALRLLVTISKVRTIMQAILLAVIGYLGLRWGKTKKIFKENQMKTFFKKVWSGVCKGLKYIFVSNPQASAATLINAFASSALGYSMSSNALFSNLPSLMIGSFDIIPVVAAIICFTLVEVFGIKWAFESNLTADARRTETAAIKAEEKAETMRAKEEKEALALSAKKEKEEAEAKAKAERETRLLALAAEIKAKETIAQAQENGNETINKLN